jgi:hypothetical protein
MMLEFPSLKREILVLLVKGIGEAVDMTFVDGIELSLYVCYRNQDPDVSIIEVTVGRCRSSTLPTFLGFSLSHVSDRQHQVGQVSC